MRCKERAPEQYKREYMIKELYKKVALPISMILTLKKYGGIWKLKEHLAKADIPNKRLLAIYDAYFSRTGSWIGYNSKFDAVPCFPHGTHGIFISNGARIGRNAVIFQHVTIGSNTLNDSNRTGSPTIGEAVYIGAGAKIIGGITIGKNCRIGANAVVYQDMPPNSVAVQSPTRIIQKDNLDNRFYSQRKGRWEYFDDGNWIEDQHKTI